MTTRFAAHRRGAAVVLLMLLAACGGGGGGGANNEPDAPDAALPTLSTDTVPSGQRVDVSALNLFPLQPGDEWVYADSRSTANQVTRSVTASPADARDVLVTETDPVDGSAEPGGYRVTPQGIVSLDPAGAQGLWPGVYAALPSIIEYPTPLYPVGGERKSVRQGSMGADLDGDGANDFYRLEISQVFRGFETIRVLGADTEVAHFTNQFVFSVSATSDGSRYTATAIEQTYFAPGLGLVRSDRSATDSDGAVIVAPYSLTLLRATVDGLQRDGQAGSVRTLALAHNALIFDAARGVYYASVPGSATQGNRIAVITPATGAVRYSGPVGSEPGPMAIASDGASMLVGLAGSGEVVRLALPALTVSGRVRLPVDGTFGQLRAEQIATSPVAPGVFAVSLIRPNVSPRHGGVVLVRDLALQPVRTQDHTGSNLIGFGADGRWLYGFNNETTELGLRRIEVLADGLAERTVVATNGRFGQALHVIGDRILVGSSVFRADASLALLGTLADTGSCVALSTVDRFACQEFFGGPLLEVFDATTLVRIATLPTPPTATYAATRYVPGPLGVLAVSDQETISLIDSPLLR
jgi:hypothetical protein